tara:strand:- start:1735 stop:2070 length:336 start_codon:yes stop_codon:yes gene_type:complete
VTEEQVEESRLRAQFRFQAFLDETARLERQNKYWDNQARYALKRICFLYECSDCGKLVGAKHALNCPDRDLTPVMPSELSLSERLQRREDIFNDWNWDYDANVAKLAELLT